MKTIKKQLRRAFTIVELVIVIAVIAALAAILIPTFVNVLDSANESVDTSLVKNLNTILASEETLNGAQASTMSEALEWADENGYSVDKLTPTSSGDILWNQNTNRFVLVNSDGEIIYQDGTTEDSLGYTYWKIIHKSSEISASNVYSLYYAADYDGTISGSVSNIGIDVSDYTAATVNITYTSSDETTQNVIINGNGGMFTATDSDKTDEISVYNVSTLNAEKVADASLHIHGVVTGNIYLEEGHIEVEASAELSVPYVVITGTNASVTSEKVSVKVVISSDVTDTSKITVSGSAATQIDETYDVKTLEKFAGGLGTSDAPYQIATAEQFINIGDFSDDMVETSYYFELTDNIDLSKSDISGNYVSYYFNGVLEGNNKIITCKSGLSYLFMYVFGETQFNNFKAVWSDNNITRVFCNEAIYANSYDSTNEVFITDTEIVSVSYNNVDFEGVTGTIYGVGSKNTALYFTENNDKVYMVLKNNGIYEIDETNPWYENTVVTGRTQTKKTPTSMVEHVQTMIDCDVNADLTCTDYAAVFSAGQCYNTETIIKNCSYTGTFQGVKPGLIFANGGGYKVNSVFSNDAETYTSSWGKVTVENVSLYGNIIASSSGDNVYFGTTVGTLSGITYGESRYTLISKDSTLALTTSDSQYVITAATTSCGSYYVQLQLGKVNWYDSDYTSSYGENSNMLLTIEVSTSNIANTGIYKATALSLKQAKDKGIVDSSYTCNNISIEGRSYSFVYYNETWYIIVDLDNGYGLFAEEKQCTAYVYGVVDALPVCKNVEES